MTRRYVKRWAFLVLFVGGAALAVSRPALDGLVLLGIGLMVPFVISVWTWEITRGA